MSTAQILQESLKTSIFGMGLVLSTLFILSLILDLMRVVFAPKTSVKKNEIIVTDEVTNEQELDAKSDTELVAVITAALSQYLEVPISNIKVGNIRQIHTKTPAWGMVSRIHNINNGL